MSKSPFNDLMGELGVAMFDRLAAKTQLDTGGWKFDTLVLPPTRAGTYVCPVPWGLSDPAPEPPPVRPYFINMEGWVAEHANMLEFEFYMRCEVPVAIRKAVLALLPPDLTTPPAMWEQFPGEPDTHWGIRWERGDRSLHQQRWMEVELYPDGQLEWMYLNHATYPNDCEYQGDRELGQFNTLATTDIARFRACLAKVLGAA